MRRPGAFFGALALVGLAGSVQAQYYPYSPAYSYGSQNPGAYFPQANYLPYQYGYQQPAYQQPVYQRPQTPSYQNPAYNYSNSANYSGNGLQAPPIPQPWPFPGSPMGGPPVISRLPSTNLPDSNAPGKTMAQASPQAVPERLVPEPRTNQNPPPDAPVANAPGSDNSNQGLSLPPTAPETVELFPGPYTSPGGSCPPGGDCSSCKDGKDGNCEKCCKNFLDCCCNKAARWFDSCCKCVAGCKCFDGCHYYGEVGFLFLQPRWQSNPAFLFNTLHPNGSTSVSQQDFRYGWNFTPQANLGIIASSGTGIRGHWYMFDQVDTQNTATVAGNQIVDTAAPLGLFNSIPAGSNAQAHSRLFLHAADLEGTQDFLLGSTLLRFGGGARYAHLQQNYDAYTFTGGANTSVLHSVQTFNGVGPTIALDGLHQFGNTGLGIYARGRGSVLFGNYPQNVSITTLGTVTSTASRSPQDTIPLFELEAGFQYTRPVGHTLFFVRTGAAAFTWFGVGNSSNSTPNFNGLALDPNAQNRSNLTLLGLSFMTGFYY